MNKIVSKLKSVVFFILCFAIVISVPAIAVSDGNSSPTEEEQIILTLWQVDNFEGGRGSRAAYLQNIANNFYKSCGCYVNVISVSAEAVKLNIESKIVPDLISYGAGMVGIENIINSYTEWCHGGYCFLSLEEDCNFSDITNKNTIINGGVNNFVKAAALLNGISDAVVENPTGAYVKLINGDYKYLLGTQRDIYRLKTRGVAFSVQPITNFNDLYQNISVTTTQSIRADYSKKFISYMLENGDVTKLGLMHTADKLYDDEMSIMEGLSYDYKLTSPISISTKDEIISAIEKCDENKLKNILK